MSRLAQLPPELFNMVLSHLLNAEQVERAPTTAKLRGYAFQLAILRVNKEIHALAKSYLDNANTCIQFDINPPAIDPSSFDAPIFVLARKWTPPVPALNVKLRFPKVPEAIHLRRGTETSFKVVLVLQRDLTKFMRLRGLFPIDDAFDDFKAATRFIDRHSEDGLPTTLDYRRIRELHQSLQEHVLEYGYLSKKGEVRMEEAIERLQQLDMPLAYWEVHDSQIPIALKDDVAPFLNSSEGFTKDQSAMTAHNWKPSRFQLGDGFGEVYFI
ncbi:hypothetical protein EK21DRAFT_118101 [Setomelanomma holmii]|uniref:F-box domain-containing protein n=1 Tax=Setomelanomma holmii TaxID=210430 RepID=A0A9P4LHG3_9PLEO|nr:hypothetical protein EK21DRAFT_118101 [Setomelanomma holmii]